MSVAGKIIIGMAGPRRFRFIPVLIFVLALLAGSGLSPRLAAAHAVLVASSPSQGEHLQASPKTLTLHFSETVTRVSISLVGADEPRADLPAAINGADVSVELPAPLADGPYALNWRVLSEDGHPVAASIVFAVGKTSDTGRLHLDASPHAPAIAIATYIAKTLFYASCMFSVGGVFFAFWIAQARPGLWIRVLLFLGSASAIVLVGLLGLDANGLPLTAIADPIVWITALESSLASSMGVAFGSLLLGLASLRVARSSARVFSLLSIVTLGPAFALTGHASGAGLAWLSFAAVSIHVIAATFWAGALPGLWRLLVSDDPGALAGLARFSTLIPVSIAALLAAGAYMAWLQVVNASSLWNTPYGNVLLAKLALVAITLAIAAFNRVLLTAPAVEGSRSAALSMRRLVVAEILLIVLVLAVTALWRFTPPPRELAQVPPTTTTMHIHTEQAMATVSFRTSPTLRFGADISLQTAGFDLLDPMDVTMRMASTDGRVEAFDVPLHRVSAGLWRADDVQAPCECTWDVRLGVLISDFDQVALEGEISLTAKGQ
ncbi:copper resistance protein CopC [Rhizobium sp. LjRoot30]|uniref:copper resistance CopC/CopD family protein n=1 Tax=Rhizobium sp. LjRoot30 TaxID=3342320 RepID=UPI003ED12DA3